jgi:hypothetical protein
MHDNVYTNEKSNLELIWNNCISFQVEQTVENMWQSQINVRRYDIRNLVEIKISSES